jgi:drug/metabolite transporter (DMT)-like permease
MQRSVWITFATLCLLSSSAWVIEPFGVSTLPALERQGLLFGTIGLVFLLFSARSLLRDGQWRSLALLAMAGTLFFGLPSVAIELASGVLPQADRSILFTMVPIVIVVVTMAGEAKLPIERGAAQFLIPALAGLSGILLLLPFSFYGNARSVVVLALLCIAVVLSGVASVWIFRLLQEFTLPCAAAVICLANAALLLLCSTVVGTPLWGKSDLASLLSLSSLATLIEIPLLLWLLSRLPPIRLAARCFAIPLLSVLEGFAVVRLQPTLRMAAGVALLATGAGALLLLNPSQDQAGLSLR